jgi:hypothetical protein
MTDSRFEDRQFAGHPLGEGVIIDANVVGFRHDPLIGLLRQVLIEQADGLRSLAGREHGHAAHDQA